MVDAVTSTIQGPEPVAKPHVPGKVVALVLAGTGPVAVVAVGAPPNAVAGGRQVAFYTGQGVVVAVGDVVFVGVGRQVGDVLGRPPAVLVGEVAVVVRPTVVGLV